MKTLIFINGPNGVGKSTLCSSLIKRLPHSSWLESEWCRCINPFDLTPEIAEMTVVNMTTLLRGYLQCSLVDYVIFNYGLHGPRKRIFENVIDNLRDISFRLLPITLMCSEEENINRMIHNGRYPERIQSGLKTRQLYENSIYQTIDTTKLTVDETVAEILAILQDDGLSDS